MSGSAWQMDHELPRHLEGRDRGHALPTRWPRCSPQFVSAFCAVKELRARHLQPRHQLVGARASAVAGVMMRRDSSPSACGPVRMPGAVCARPDSALRGSRRAKGWQGALPLHVPRPGRPSSLLPWEGTRQRLHATALGLVCRTPPLLPAEDGGCPLTGSKEEPAARGRAGGDMEGKGAPAGLGSPDHRRPHWNVHQTWAGCGRRPCVSCVAGRDAQWIHST